MKHKHYDLIIAWATGAEIQSRNDISGCWEDNPKPMWAHNTMYRIKPEPRPQWQQYLIDAAKAGKVVEIKGIKGIDEWIYSDVNHRLEDYKFGDNKQDRYRIRPEKVTRYLWAYGKGNHWVMSSTFRTDAEADGQGCKIKRLDYTATEFEE